MMGYLYRVFDANGEIVGRFNYFDNAIAFCKRTPEAVYAVNEAGWRIWARSDA